ncbi:MAG TPA: VWA domain-containing protein [Clostridiaceae bacterium]|nr:VWA domain-containing protein [Clostridiaceae bacterium]
MNKDRTELIFILDKSGSMGGLEADTIGGYNAMLKKQKEVEGECTLTTVLFDNSYELLHDRLDIRAVEPLTEREYQVGGSTALLDAMGRTIHKIISVQKNSSDEFKAGKVIFVIITDGQENSSREYSLDRIKGLVEKERDRYGWEFIFLGANMDAIQTGGAFGIAPDRALDYLADSQGTQLSYSVMSETITSFRKNGSIPQDKLDRIRGDVKERGGRDRS